MNRFLSYSQPRHDTGQTRSAADAEQDVRAADVERHVVDVQVNIS
jgi:hypothetical protein